jgi:toxin CptA
MKPQLSQPVNIEIKPSGLLLGLLCLISIAASIILWQLSEQMLFRLAFLLLVTITTIYFVLRDALLLLPQSWKVLSINTNGKLEMVNKRGERFQPILTGETFVHPYLTILNIERSGLHFDLPPLMLLSGQADRQQLRRLHVWLNWSNPHQDSKLEEGLVA